MARSPASATLHVALFRGINVAGKNKLPMRDLVAMFDEAGCGDVCSYIQSGNIVFRAGTRLAARIPGLVAADIAKRFGLRVPVVLRSADELREAAENNPFVAAGREPATLHVVFLADAPARARVVALDPARSPTDTFTVRGREIYLCCPNGLGKSKLTNEWFDRQLATTSTVRNWNTVQRLVEMTQGG